MADQPSMNSVSRKGRLDGLLGGRAPRLRGRTPMDPNTIVLSILVPVYNELATIEAIIEQAYILWVLQSEGGNKSRTAEVLGIDPSTLYRKLSRYGVEA